MGKCPVSRSPSWLVVVFNIAWASCANSIKMFAFAADRRECCSRNVGRRTCFAQGTRKTLRLKDLRSTKVMKELQLRGRWQHSRRARQNHQERQYEDVQPLQTRSSAKSGYDVGFALRSAAQQTVRAARSGITSISRRSTRSRWYCISSSSERTASSECFHASVGVV
jgi:hypothetical protein